MAFMPLCLFPTALLTTGFTILCQGQANGYAVIKRAIFTVQIGVVGTVNLSVWRVRSGQSPNAGNILIDTMPLGWGVPFSSNELSNMVLSAGDMIQALCSANNAMNATVSGYTGP